MAGIVEQSIIGPGSQSFLKQKDDLKGKIGNVMCK